MNRREFLKLLLTMLASAGVSACIDALEPQPAPDVPDANAPWDVIVVGAGITGLRAAQKLQQDGQRVLLLEARNRIGGRIGTDTDNGQPLDLGVPWIHGIRGNPITTLANQPGATLITTDYEDLKRFDANGKLLSADLNHRVEELLERHFELAREYAENQDYDISLRAALEAVLRVYPLNMQDLRLLNYAVNTRFEHEHAAASSQLSAWYFDGQEEFDGGDVIFSRGYRFGK